MRDHYSKVGVHKIEGISKSSIKYLTELCVRFLQTDKFKEENFKAQL